MTYTLDTQPGEGMCLALRWFPQFAWIKLNGAVVGEHSGDVSIADGVDFSTFVMDELLKAGPTTLEFTMCGDAPRDFESHVALIAYPIASALGDWGFRAWQSPTARDAQLPTAGDPAWWSCRFTRPELPGPFFLVTRGLTKGQAYLNGHALGRYWEIGPQHALYVPDSWLIEDNEMNIFDEGGAKPSDIYLSRDARVPTHRLLA